MVFGLWTGQNSRGGLWTGHHGLWTGHLFSSPKVLWKDCSYDQLWPVMTSYDELWPAMMSYDQIWPVMTTYDQLRCGRRKLDQFWLVIISYVRQVMRGYD